MYKIKEEVREAIIKLQLNGFKAVDIKKKISEKRLKKMQIAGVMSHHTRGTYGSPAHKRLRRVV